MKQLGRKPLLVASCSVLLLFFSGCARRINPASSSTQPAALLAGGRPVRVSSGDVDAAEPAVAAGPDGTAYVAWVEHRPNKQADVWLSRFDPAGKPKGSAVRINPGPGQATAWRGDPPTVAVAPDNSVYVGWTGRGGIEQSSAADLYLSTSHDAGQTFATPVKVNDDPKPGPHGMHSLAIIKNTVYLAWLDERNVKPVPMKDGKMPANTGGHHMESNREVFLASSVDGGRTFSRNKRVATNACPCCKTALGINADGRVYVSWRQVLPGDLRHIAVTSSTDQGETFSPAVIVSDDQWVLAGCPVSGSALAIGENGVLRVLWYSAGKNGQTGLYWSESHDSGATFAPRQLVTADLARGTPVLLVEGEKFAALWQVGDNDRAAVRRASLGSGTTVPISQTLTSGGEVPAADTSGAELYLVYSTESDNRRSVWLVSTE